MYAPNLDSPGYFMQTFNTIEGMGNDLQIVAGDLNCVLAENRDKKGGRPHAHKLSANFINAYIEMEDMVDIWRYYNPDTFRFTWQKKNPNIVIERLDYILISEALCMDAQAVGIEACCRSDHSIPWLEISKDSTQKGIGFWKLNTSLLNDEICKQMVGQIIEEEKTKGHPSTSILWE